MNDEAKRAVLKRYNKLCSTFVETGSAIGETSLWASKNFKRVVTIEFQDNNYKTCVERFFNVPNILPLHGDSCEWIKSLVYLVGDTPALWFLDAHFTHGVEDIKAPSGNTPIVQELETLFGFGVKHYIVVDDLNLFGVEEGYPTLDEVVELGAKFDYVVETEDNLIICTHRKSKRP